MNTMKSKTYEMYGMELTLLMQQDECAPDSRQWLDERMMEKFGFDVSDLKSKGVFSSPDELTMMWIAGEFMLMYCGDDPFYKLYHIDKILPMVS